MDTPRNTPTNIARRRRRFDPVTSAVLAIAVLVLGVVLVVAVSVFALWDESGTKRTAKAPSWQLEDGAVVTAVPATLVEVLDGDTAVYRLDDGALEKVRMIGIDAPESVNESGTDAADSKRHAQELLGGHPRVFLEEGVNKRDRYDQMLAYVWLMRPTQQPTAAEVQNKMLNAKMVLDGYAKEYPATEGVSYENDRYTPLLTSLAAEAKQKRRGFWNTDSAQVPGTTRAWATDASTEATPITSPFVGNRTSRKFHRASCENAAEMRVDNRILMDSRSNAVKDGFVPCGVCDP